MMESSPPMNPLQSNEFGIYLRNLRVQAGLTQDELGTRIGLSGTYISRVERARDNPFPDEVLPRLAQALPSASLDKLYALAGRIPTDLRNQPEVLAAAWQWARQQGGAA